MATKYLSANASLSAAVWWTTSGGSTTTTAPGVGDDANLNAHTLTVDQTMTCDNIVGAGTLAVSGSQTINANLGNSTSTWSATFSSAQTITINGNLTGRPGSITISGGSTVVNITGNVTGSPSSNDIAIFQSSGTLTITGSVTGGSGGGQISFGIQYSGGVLVVNGDVTASLNSAAIATAAWSGATVSVTINGNVTNSVAFTALKINNSLPGTFTINGNVAAHANAPAVFLDGVNCVMSVSGSVAGSDVNGNNGQGIMVRGGTLTLSGTVTGGSGVNTSTVNYGNIGVLMIGGVLTITGNIVDGAVSAVAVVGQASFTYSPATGKTATIGGTTLTAGSSSTVIVIEDD